MSDKAQQEEAKRLLDAGTPLETQAIIKRNAKLSREILNCPEKYKVWTDELIRLQLEAEDNLADYTAMPPKKGGDWMERHISVCVWTIIRDHYKSFGIEIPKEWMRREMLLKERALALADAENKKPEDVYEDDGKGIDELATE